MADPLNPLTEEEQALADATAACLDILFGDGAFDAYLQAAFAADGPLKACIQACVVDVLTNEETSPITKEYLGEVIQGEDVDDSGTLGAQGTLEQVAAGEAVISATGTIVTSVKGSKAVVVLPREGK